MIGTVPASDRAVDPSAALWALSLVGQFLAVFGLIALSGPGRMHIVDGQVRYEDPDARLGWMGHGDGSAPRFGL
jgi:hypothetical protein